MFSRARVCCTWWCMWQTLGYGAGLMNWYRISNCTAVTAKFSYSQQRLTTHCSLSDSTIYFTYQRNLACMILRNIPHISALWPVWLHNIFHISAHCGLSGSTIYSTYQRTVGCLTVLYIPNISALWPVWFYFIFHISAHCGLSDSIIYSTYQRTVVCLALQYIPPISELWSV
jgi:hypothetical protein